VIDLPIECTHGYAASNFERRTGGGLILLSRVGFTEKLWYRMLYDRSPTLTLLCDKLRVRDYVSEKVGTKYLVPLLWHGEDPEAIPFPALPPRFVIKTNMAAAM